LYGFFSGAVVSIQAACVGQILTDPKTIGAGIGQMFATIAIAGLLGPPINGWLIGYNGYVPAAIFSGTLITFGALVIVSNFVCSSFVPFSMCDTVFCLGNGSSVRETQRSRCLLTHRPVSSVWRASIYP
jgi:MFS family permease